MQLHHIFSNAPSGIRYYVTCVQSSLFRSREPPACCTLLFARSRARKTGVALRRERASRGRGRIQPWLLGFSKNDELSKKRDRFVTRIIALMLSLPLERGLFSLALLSAFSSAQSGRFAAHRLLLISTSCINVSITRLSATAAALLLLILPLLFLPPGPFAYSRASSRRMDRLVCPHAILITGLKG